MTSRKIVEYITQGATTFFDGEIWAYVIVTFNAKQVHILQLQ